MCFNLCAPVVIITVKHSHRCQLSDITAVNAIGADSAASLLLVSKAANSLPNFGSQR